MVEECIVIVYSKLGLGPVGYWFDSQYYRYHFVVYSNRIQIAIFNIKCLPFSHFLYSHTMGHHSKRSA